MLQNSFGHRYGMFTFNILFKIIPLVEFPVNILPVKSILQNPYAWLLFYEDALPNALDYFNIGTHF